MVGIILTRTIYVDILRSRETLEAQAEIDSKGWKLIHGDVFRRPRFVSLLNALVAFGVQTLGTALLLVCIFHRLFSFFLSSFSFFFLCVCVCL